MPPGHAHARPGAVQHVGAQQSQTAVAGHQRPRARRHLDLVQHLQRGGQGLGEHGLLVGHRVGHRVQVGRRQREPLGEAAVAPEDAEHRAPGRVARVVGAGARGLVDGAVVRGALARWGHVDVAHHAASGQAAVQRDAHELVAGYAGEVHVAPGQGQVGGADPGQAHGHGDLAGERPGLGQVVAHPGPTALQHEPAHPQKSAGLRPMSTMAQSWRAGRPSSAARASSAAFSVPGFRIRSACSTLARGSSTVRPRAGGR